MDSLPATAETIEKLKRLRDLKAQQLSTERESAAARFAVLAEATPGIELTPDQQEADVLLTGPQRHTLLVGGSRSGKTTLFVRAIGIRALRASNSRHAILRFRGNAARGSISLDTLPKVFRMCWPDVDLHPHDRDGYYSLPNGSEIWVGGLDDKERVEKILGKEFATLFLNECSQIPYSSVMLVLTRLAQVVPGLMQRAYYDLNPIGKGHWTNELFGNKRDPITRQPLSDPQEYQRLFLNPAGNARNLSPEYLRSLQQLPERQRKRFWEGVYIDEVEGALWTYERIEQLRVAEFPLERCVRLVVAVDASGASGPDDDTKAEIGIVVAGLGDDGHYYVHADRSLRDSPAVWGRTVAIAYHEFRADQAIAEINFGGEMVRYVIQVADRNIPVKVITASRNKAIRAEPVAALYEQELVHHVGRFGLLEDQLCAFTTSGYRGLESPDRADALAWALTELMNFAAARENAYFASEMNQAKTQKRICRVSVDPVLPVKAFFNVGGSGQSDVIGVWVTQFVGKEIRLLQYAENTGIADTAADLRKFGYEKAECILPHYAATAGTTKRFEDHLRDAGFEVGDPIVNQGTNAAMLRIEAARRILPRCWFNEGTTTDGRKALSFYHERRDDAKGVGLGPEFDWSAYAADSFGLMAIAYEEPVVKKERKERPRELSAWGV